MSTRTNSAEGGTDETTVTTGNSGGASGTAWDVVSIGAGSSLVFDSAESLHGGFSYRITSSGTTTVIMRWTPTATEVRVSVHFKLTDATPAAAIPLIEFRNATGLVARMRVETSGLIRVFNLQGGVATQVHIFATPLASGTWYRAELRVVVGTGATDGTIECAYYIGNNVTPEETAYSANNVDTGTTSITDLRLGLVAGTAFDTQPIWIDSVQYGDGVDAVDLLLPWPSEFTLEPVITEDFNAPDEDPLGPDLDWQRKVFLPPGGEWKVMTNRGRYRAGVSRGMTVEELFATSGFRIAHRGLTENKPEMTLAAYAYASQQEGIFGALEVSVVKTSDHIFACHHDLNAQRMTGVNIDITSNPYSSIAGLLNTAAFTDDPGQPAQPMCQLEEVLDQYFERFALLIELKSGKADGAAIILDLLTDLGPTAQEWICIKGAIGANANWAAPAKAAGFTTYGTMFDDEALNLPTLGTNWDVLAINYDATVTNWNLCHATGKPVAGHILNSQAQIDEAEGKGADGYMITQWPV